MVFIFPERGGNKMEEEKHPSKKLKVYPRTLDDKFVKDGLSAISLLNKKEPYYLVGGMAVQGYLPIQYRRPSSDIDFSIVRPLYNRHDFDLMTKPVIEYLGDLGYTAEKKKHSGYFGIIVSNEEDEKMLIEFAKRNENCFKKHKKKLEREFGHARSKSVEGRYDIYFSASPEDLAVPKLARSINSLKRNRELAESLLFNIHSSSTDNIKKQLEDIGSLRSEAMFSPGDVGLAERLRFISDIYDIRVLAETVGFNHSYWIEASKDWNNIINNEKERKELINFLIPFIESGNKSKH